MEKRKLKQHYTTGQNVIIGFCWLIGCIMAALGSITGTLAWMFTAILFAITCFDTRPDSGHIE
jgi:hypothetical protein